MNNFKKIFTFLIIGGAFFVAGFYFGFKNIPEVEKVYGVENTRGDTNADFSDFWKAWNIINEKHPDGLEVSSKEKVWGAIKGLVDSLNDPYTYFFTPEETEDLEIDLSGEFSGVGMEVGMRNGDLTVITPLKGSPAESAGILSGDVILQIDDVSTKDLTVDGAVKMIRGERGTEVVLVVLPEDEDVPKQVSIMRDLVNIPTLETDLRDDGVFVISLFGFSKNAEKELSLALEEFNLSGSNKMIIDLRGNPGGFLGSAINITSKFLEDGKPIVIERSSKGEIRNTYRSHGGSWTKDFDIIVLIDGGSASASEIMAGALMQNGRAELLGTKTFGKGSVQELVNFKDKTKFKITVAEWLTPDGSSISESGLTPDYVVPFDVEGYKENGVDNQLEEAVKILLGA
jgi:carboxyl-terminal processing protease